MSNYTGYALGTDYAIAVATADSTGGGSVDYLYDGLITSEWNSGTSGTTHWVKLSLPRSVWIAGLRLYLSSTGINNWNNCAIYISTQNLDYGDDWGSAVYSGDLSPEGADQWNESTFTEAWGRYILIVATVTAGQALYAKEVDVYILSIIGELGNVPTNEQMSGSLGRFWIEIGDSAGNRYGPGPITSAHYWEHTKRVDRAGEFTFAMPLADEKADWIQPRFYARCYALLANGPQLVGSGVIDSIEQTLDTDGNINLVVNGSDLMRELMWRSVEYLPLASGLGPVSHTVAVALLAIAKPTNWTFIPASYPPNDEIYYYYAGESLLAAAITLAELTRVHVWMSDEAVLSFTNEWDTSGLRAIQASVNPNIAADNVCLIADLAITTETHDTISRIIPYGAEISDLPGSYVSLFNTTRSAPTGYTLSTADKYIKRNSTEAEYGRTEQFVKYSDIKANSSAAADLESAANQLFDLALYDLQRRSQPTVLYQLTLAHAPVVIEPMQTIRVVYRRAISGRLILDIDEDLYIMGATTRIDSDGLRTTVLDVATVDRWPPSDVDPIRRSTRNSLRIR